MSVDECSQLTSHLNTYTHTHSYLERFLLVLADEHILRQVDGCVFILAHVELHLAKLEQSIHLRVCECGCVSVWLCECVVV
jgi:hypothetical protein